MSMVDKVRGLMGRPSDDLANKDDVSVWMKYAARGLGTLGGGIAIFLGVWASTNIIFAEVGCLVAGVWQMLAGFLVLVAEAPCCCAFIDFVSVLSDKFEKMQYWKRGGLYVGLAIPPIFMCFGVSTVLGSGLIFATGVLYGLMGLGKKASQEEMQNNATGRPTVASNDMYAGSGFKSSLVDNAQPVSFTGSPHVV